VAVLPGHYARSYRYTGTDENAATYFILYAPRKAYAEYPVKSHQVSHKVAYATSRADLLDLVARGLLNELHPKNSRGVIHRPSKAPVSMVR
jgi:Fic family protein